MKDIVTIKCERCGREYMPGEIFMPNAFFGKQTEVVRSPSGEIDFYIGSDMDLTEEFECECGAKMAISANLSFTVRPIEEENFDEDYVTPVKKVDKLNLEEELLF